MPQLSNITIKKADGTTDVVYTGLSPAAGDKTPSMHRAETAHAQPALRPTMELSGQFNGPRTARRMNGTYKYPHVVTLSGVDSAPNSSVGNVSFVAPQAVDSASQAEAVHQFLNMLSSAEFKAAFLAGYSFT